MKKLLLLMVVAMVASISAQAQIFSENFNTTTGTVLPVDWRQIGTGWKSGTTASLNSGGNGSFNVSGPYDGRLAGINDDKVDGANDNAILITAPIDLSDATSAALSFYAFYVKGSYQGATENLDVVSSIDNGDSWQVVRTVDANQNAEWEKRSYIISNLVGNDSVLIGFRYSDGGGWLFGAFIDNVEVFVPKAKDAELVAVGPDFGSLYSYVRVGNSADVEGTIYNNAGEPLTDFTINYQDGSNPVQSYKPDVTIAPFESYDFTHDIPLTVSEARDYPINVWVSLEGDEELSNDTLNTAGFKYFSKDVTKKPLYEEATGSWCGWCPRGTVNMEVLAEEHPGEASQVAVHNNDNMAVAAYDALMGTYISGYPSIVYDRRVVDDPGNLVTAHASERSSFGFAEVTMGEVSENGLDITIPVTISPAVTLVGAKVAIIVTESNLRGIGTSWDQVNYYAGGAQGVMGGWETEADKVPNTFYHFVGRSIGPNVNGAKLTLPDTLLETETYTVELTTKLNASWNKANLQYIVALIGEDNTVYNTAATELPVLKPALADVALAVKNLDGVNKVAFYPNPVADQGTLDIDIKEGASATVVITDVVGKVVYRKPVTMTTGSNKYSINTSNLTNGVYFITVGTAKGQTTLMFNKTK